MQITQPRTGHLRKGRTEGSVIILTPQDYVNLVTAINSKIDINGGQLQGYLSVHADPVLPMHVANKRYVDNQDAAHAALLTAHGSTAAAIAGRIVQRDANGRTQMADPAVPQDVATAAWTNARIGMEISAHAALTNAHGATVLATAGRIIIRDANGRAQVADPVAADDIATRRFVVAQGQIAIDEHAAQTNVHGASSAGAANRIIIRDAAGRAQVAAPAVSADIARLAEVQAVQANLASHINDAGNPHAAVTEVDAIANKMVMRDQGGRVRGQAAVSPTDLINLGQLGSLLVGYVPINQNVETSLRTVGATMQGFIQGA